MEFHKSCGVSIDLSLAKYSKRWKSFVVSPRFTVKKNMTMYKKNMTMYQNGLSQMKLRNSVHYIADVLYGGGVE